MLSMSCISSLHPWFIHYMVSSIRGKAYKVNNTTEVPTINKHIHTQLIENQRSNKWIRLHETFTFVNTKGKLLQDERSNFNNHIIIGWKIKITTITFWDKSTLFNTCRIPSINPSGRSLRCSSCWYRRFEDASLLPVWRLSEHCFENGVNFGSNEDTYLSDDTRIIVPILYGYRERRNTGQGKR